MEELTSLELLFTPEQAQPWPITLESVLRLTYPTAVSKISCRQPLQQHRHMISYTASCAAPALAGVFLIPVQLSDVRLISNDGGRNSSGTRWHG